MDKLVVIMVVIGGEFIVEECNFLFVVYKNVIGFFCVVWCIVFFIEQKEEGCKNDDYVVLVCDYCVKVENEFFDVCVCILKFLDVSFIFIVFVSEFKVFYLKMKGDYYWYLVEFKVGDEWKIVVEDIMYVYKNVQVWILFRF